MSYKFVILPMSLNYNEIINGKNTQDDKSLVDR